MRVAVLKEPDTETRIPLTPKSAEKLVKLGAEVAVEKGLGESIGVRDSAYEEVGAKVDSRYNLESADVILQLNVPKPKEVEKLKRGAILASLMDPFRNPALVKTLKEKEISALCMELIPRSTYAQKMDALSSQASLAGYAAVITAAERIQKALPMMSTPAGTIAPARVFVIGVGVAGLQAIATAKRLGARVEAFDTRPSVEEQVQSLGAKFVKIDLGETGQTDQGYAKELTDEQLKKQRQGMAKVCANSDIVITTAQLFGRPAPRIVTGDMVKGMRPGSVIVDLAASTGGNVEGSKPDEEVEVNGVKIIGLSNLPGSVARDASQMYASNLANLIDHLWNKESKEVELNLDDPIVSGCLLTHRGKILHEGVRALLEGKAEKPEANEGQAVGKEPIQNSAEQTPEKSPVTSSTSSDTPTKGPS